MAQRSWIGHDAHGAAPASPGVPGPPGSFEVRSTGTAGEVLLRGELDAYTAPQLDAVLSAVARPGGPKRIVVDLGELDFIDVSGVDALVSANQGAQRTGSQLVLRGVPRQTLKLLEITGLNQVFTIEDR